MAAVFIFLGLLEVFGLALGPCGLANAAKGLLELHGLEQSGLSGQFERKRRPRRQPW